MIPWRVKVSVTGVLFIILEIHISINHFVSWSETQTNGWKINNEFQISIKTLLSLKIILFNELFLVSISSPLCGSTTFVPLRKHSSRLSSCRHTRDRADGQSLRAFCTEIKSKGALSTSLRGNCFQMMMIVAQKRLKKRRILGTRTTFIVDNFFWTSTQIFYF